MSGRGISRNHAVGRRFAIGHRGAVRRLRNRRGAMVALLGVMFFALIFLAAVAVDFSMLQARKNQLQTAADAAALAGATQLLEHPARAADTAIVWGRRNVVMRDSVAITGDDIGYGRWDDAAQTFTASDAAHANAIRVSIRQDAPYLMARVFDYTSLSLPASAIAWADAPVAMTTDCVKPWALPYAALTSKLNPSGDPRQPLTQSEIDRLNFLTTAGLAQDSLAFVLTDASADTSTPTADNYFAVDLPVLWRVSTGGYAVPGPASGGAGYEAAITTCDSSAVQAGDSLQSERDSAVFNAAADAITRLCGGLDCSGYDGGRGYPMKAALWLDAPTGGSNVRAQVLGAFRLTSFMPAHDTLPSELHGYFVSMFDPGTLARPGTGFSPLQKPILVR